MNSIHFQKTIITERTLLYIDIHGWAKSEVKNVDVVEIIKRKSEERIKIWKL